MKKLKVILIGAGLRGQVYTDYMTDERFDVIAVADPVDAVRNYIKEKHNIADDMCFNTWEEILDRPKFADIAIIATMDKLHHAPALKAIDLGYDLLLEKPVCTTAKECADIANAAKEKGAKVLVCHVLRYTPFFGKIKEMITDGLLGTVYSVHHAECVGNEHHSHSFVRGNWGNTERSSCMLLQKSCHDIDIIQWLIDQKCTKVQSFGTLSYFKRENAPEGSPERCLDGCPHADTCHYNAKKLYVEGSTSWFRNACANKVDPTDEEVIEALNTTQYGKCVYKCDNDVVDHQVVNLEFENGAIASFNMSSFNDMGRYIRVMGTEGELYGDMDGNTIEYFSFATREKTLIKPADADTVDGSLLGGHGGGDEGIINVLYDYIANDYNGNMLSEISVSVDNHLTVFAAEKSRLEGKIIDMDEFKKQYLNY